MVESTIQTIRYRARFEEFAARAEAEGKPTHAAWLRRLGDEIEARAPVPGTDQPLCG